MSPLWAIASSLSRFGKEDTMAIDRNGAGLAVTRICLGVFLLFQGLGKYQWFADTSFLAGRF